MAKPTPGNNYTVVAETSFEEISTEAYGQPKFAADIRTSNRVSPLSAPYPGQELFIPFQDSEYSTTIIQEIASGGPGFSKKEIEQSDPFKWDIMIGGDKVLFTGLKFIRSLSNACYETVAELPWNRYQMTGDASQRLIKNLRPYSYVEAKVYLGGYRMMTGHVFETRSKKSANGISKTITICSKTAHLVDSTMIAPLQFREMTLRQIAEKVCKRFDIEVAWFASDKKVFKRVKSEDGEKCFDFLVRLAKQRGVLFGCDEDQRLTASDTDEDYTHVGALTDLEAHWEDHEFVANGRQRFSLYTAKSKEGKHGNVSTVHDLNVPYGRSTSVTAEDCHDGDMKRAAEWHRSKVLAESLAQPLEIRGYLAPDKDYWKEGLLIDVCSEIMEIDEGYTFLIDSVTMTSGSRETTGLVLVPPGLYSGRPMKNPWPRDEEERNKSFQQEEDLYQSERKAERNAAARAAAAKNRKPKYGTMSFDTGEQSVAYQYQIPNPKKQPVRIP